MEVPITYFSRLDNVILDPKIGLYFGSYKNEYLVVDKQKQVDYGNESNIILFTIIISLILISQIFRRSLMSYLDNFTFYFILVIIIILLIGYGVIKYIRFWLNSTYNSNKEFIGKLGGYKVIYDKHLIRINHELKLKYLKDELIACGIFATNDYQTFRNLWLNTPQILKLLTARNQNFEKQQDEKYITLCGINKNLKIIPLIPENTTYLLKKEEIIKIHKTICMVLQGLFLGTSYIISKNITVYGISKEIYMEYFDPSEVENFYEMHSNKLNIPLM